MSDTGLFRYSKFTFGKYPLVVRNDIIHMDRGDTVFLWKFDKESFYHIYTVDSCGNGWSRHNISHFSSKIPFLFRVIHKWKIRIACCRIGLHKYREVFKSRIRYPDNRCQ